MQPELIGGRYRVRAAIGQGGMGTVWLCRDERLHRDVAVKQVGLLPGESVTDSARALREARSSAALSHRNVVTVYDVVEEDGHIWMVMEHVPGRSLAQLVKADGPLAPERVAAIGADVAAGLASAHALGITHRDVKPGNILVRDDGVAKISDFGIARTAGDPALTQTGLFMGTPAYFSPELARGAEPQPAADVWALGASLYAAVEGRAPYEQTGNAMAVISRIANEPPAPPRRAGFLEPALRRMLDRDPGSRWSMADAAHTLRRLADEHDERTRPTPTAALGAAAGAAAEAPAEATAEVAAEARSAATAAPAPAGRSDADQQPRRRRGVLLPLLGIVAVLLVAAVVFAAVNQPDQNGPERVAGGAPSSGADRTPAGSPSASSPTPSASASSTTSPEGSEAAEPSQDASPVAPPGNGATSPAAVVRQYYDVVPGDLDTGWSMLGPGLRAIGQDRYDRFWNSIESVQTSRFTTGPGGDSVDVTLRFTRKDGTVSVERHRLDLIRDDDGGYLINDDTNLG
jgi:eukaryotic-like serine/threonine-protein kinase